MYNKTELIELLACKWRAVGDKFDIIKNCKDEFYEDCSEWDIDPIVVLKEIQHLQ